MASNVARYQIIDEPQTKPWAESLIVQPVAILLIAIVVPLFWNPPMLGRFWIPLVWLIANGVFLGSATLKKEILFAIGGVIAWWAATFAIVAWANTQPFGLSREDGLEYMVIAQYSIFFLTLYLIIFNQSNSYALFEYVRERSNG